MKGLFVALTGFFLVTCATTSDYKNVSSGVVGCSPEEIDIVGDIETNYWHGYRYWKVRCDGRLYYCSMVAGKPISCKAKRKKRRKTYDSIL